MRKDAPLIDVVRNSPQPEDVPIVLLLHGMGGNDGQWNLVVEQLCELPVALAFGAPVLSHAFFGGMRPTVTQLAIAMAAELKDRSCTNVIVLSHSVGSFVALRLAHEAPDLIKSVLAVNGGLTGVARFIHQPLREIVVRPKPCCEYLLLFATVGMPFPKFAKRTVANHEWLSHLTLRKFVSASGLKSVSRRRSLLSKTGKPEALLALWENRHHWVEFEQYAGKVDVPVLFLAGSRDSVASEADANSMAAMLPNARVQLIEGAGHAAPLEAPKVVIEALLEILDT